MPRGRQVQTEAETEGFDAASRASSQEERPTNQDAPLTAETFRQTLLQMQQHLLLQQQQFMRDLIDRINPGGGGAPQGRELPPPVVVNEEPLYQQQLNEGNVDRSSPATMVSHRNTETFVNANATKWLATQVPEFGGQESENVTMWTKKVDKIALIHGATDATTLLAASSKLTKSARQWYDLQDGPANESWVGLRTEIVKMFDKKIPFYKTMQKVDARKWQQAKETFDQYVLAKLALLHNLDLSQRDTIHLLIGGILSAPVRAAALSLTVETVEDFMDKMRSIAEGCTESERKPASSVRAKPKTCRNCGIAGHSHQECRKEAKCFFCKKTGHRQYDCPAAREKNKAHQVQPRTMATPATVEEDTSPTEAIAYVADVAENQLELNQSSIAVDSIQGRPCELIALLDTGSAVSFVKYTVYVTFCKKFASALRPTNRKFVNVKDAPLEIVGTVEIEFTLSLLKNRSFKMSLFVIKDQAFPHDFILGRDFLSKQRLTVTFKFREQENRERNNQLSLFDELPLFVDDITETSLESHLKDIETDFALEDKQQLIRIIKEVEQDAIETVDDKYSVPVRLKDDTIFAYAPRRFAHSERLELRQITDDLLERKIIKPSVSPYCARVVPVRKKDGRLRLCVDLRPLNSRIYRQKYPFPAIEDCLTKLANKTVFTLLDLKDGFHQIRVEEQSTKYFSFATPDGQYEYNYLPFGYAEAPAEFQKRIFQVLQPLIRGDKIIVYVDDVLLPSSSVEENLATLKDVLVLLKKYSFSLNLSKCQFLRKKIEFLGYILSHEGITLTPRHTEALKNYKQPTNAVEVQRFIGLASYFRKFIHNFALKAKPLYNLLRKNTPFDFSYECISAFQMLKEELSLEPILSLYDPAADTELHTDACTTGIGAILMQKKKHTQWSVIAYFSQANNEAETRYHSFELEMLAIVRATQRFHIYLFGISFTVVTDCNALVFAVNKASLNPRIARWTLALQNYNFKMTHRPGGRMKHVDALSRSVAFIKEVPLERELELRQLADAHLQKIASKLEFEDDEKFTLVNGLIYRKDAQNLKFVVPEAMVHSLIRTYHDEVAHVGKQKTYEGVAQTYWFPSMRKKIHEYVENCFTCIMADDSTNRFEGETSLYETPKVPMETLHVDHFGPLQETHDKYKHILVVIDAFTRFTWLSPAQSTSSKEAISLLKDIFSVFGKPTYLVSDRGTAFTSLAFENFIKEFRIKHRKVAVASPWANGMVERVNRFIKSSLTKLCSEASEWKEKLNTVQYVVNNTRHTVTKSTPSKLMLGYEKRMHDDFDLAVFTQQLTQIEKTLDEERARARDVASTATNLVRQYNKTYRDAHAKKPTLYKEGDYVLIRDTRTKPGENPKLKSKYKGPYEISKSLGNNRYVVQDIPGFNMSSRPYNSILSSDKLKFWVKPISPSQ